MSARRRRRRRDVALALSIASMLVALGLGGCSWDAKVSAPRYALVYGVSLYRPTYAEGISYIDNNHNGYYDAGDTPVNNLTYSDNDAISMAD